jgi:predicted NUDIX family phosphoesterase
MLEHCGDYAYTRYRMSPNEQVLVVERKLLERVGLFHGLSFDVEKYLPILFEPGAPRFMLRSKAETHRSFKQLIPYVIIHAGNKFLSYVRGKAGGEKRLVGNRSIGIGGHINPVDELPLFGDLREAYHGAVDREVAEEVDIAPPRMKRTVALLNDDTTEVGQVHLGIVHCWTLAAPEVNKREQMITQLAFMSAFELRSARHELESWSQFCVDHLPQIIETPGHTK